MITLHVAPHTKPRMTQRDKWKPSKAAQRYWTFCDRVRIAANQAGYRLGDVVEVVFYVPMPKSWSKRNKLAMAGKPHQQTPDIDNFCKAFFDALAPQGDQFIHTIKARKVWTDGPGAIEVNPA